MKVDHRKLCQKYLNETNEYFRIDQISLDSNINYIDSFLNSPEIKARMCSSSHINVQFLVFLVDC